MMFYFWYLLFLPCLLPCLLPLCRGKVAEAAAAYESMQLHTAVDAVLAIANRGNLYLDEMQPWIALKKVSRPAQKKVNR